MRKLLLVLVALAIIGAVAFGVRALGARDQSDAVKSEDAADLVEAERSSDVEAGDRPEAGTYTYAGSGKESVDALGGSEHIFPKEIAVVVELDPDDDCAWVNNVVYVRQHIEERRYCSDGGTVTDRGFTREIEFFNQLQEAEYECGENALRRYPEAPRGSTWTWTCTEGGDTRSVYTGTYLGMETLTIGGEQVQAWHSRVTSKQSGDTVGTDTSEFWLAESGLPLRFSADLDVKTRSVLGETNFQEELDYTLTSLVPE